MKRKRAKKDKIHVVFNEDERTDYLLGFHKRKEARKMKAKDELQKFLKEEIKKIRLQQKDSLRNMLMSQRSVPEVEHLLEPKTYELPEHTVTISEVDNMDLLPYSSADVKQLNEKESSEEEAEKTSEENDELEETKDVMKKLKTQRIQAFKKSTVFSTAKVLQKKKDKKESKKKMLALKKNSKKTKKNKMTKKNKQTKRKKNKRGK